MRRRLHPWGPSGPIGHVVWRLDNLVQAAAGIGLRSVSRQPPGPSSLLRAGAGTLAASILSVVIGLASSVIIARALGPSGKGSLAVATASADLAVFILGGASIPIGITVVVSRGLASPVPALIALLGISVLQTAAAFVGFLILQLNPSFTTLLAPVQSLAAVGGMAALVGVTCAGYYSRSTLLGLQQFGAVSIRDVVGRIVGVAMIASVALGAQVSGRVLTPEVVVWALVAGGLLSVVLMLSGVARLHLERRGSRGLGDILRFARPVYGRNLIQFLNYKLDIFVVAAFIDMREVGLYALAVGLAQLLWILSNSLAVVLLPRVAAASPDRAASDTARLTRVTTLVTTLGAFAMALVAGPLIGSVYGPMYTGATPFLYLLLPGIVAYGAVKVLESYIAGIGRPKVNLLIAVAALVATVALDLLLIPILGGRGAAIASSVSYSVSSVVTVLWVSRFSRVPVRRILIVQREDLEAAVAMIRGHRR